MPLRIVKYFLPIAYFYLQLCPFTRLGKSKEIPSSTSVARANITREDGIGDNRGGEVSWDCQVP